MGIQWYYCVSLSPSESQMTKGLKHASGLLSGNAFARENRVGPSPGRESLQTPHRHHRGWEKVGHRCARDSTELPGNLSQSRWSSGSPRNPGALASLLGPVTGWGRMASGQGNRGFRASSWGPWMIMLEPETHKGHILTINNYYKYRYPN